MVIHMHRISHPLAFVLPLLLTVASTPASAVSHFSGSYRVVQKAEVGAQTHVRMQIRLVNQGHPDLHIQRITLWVGSHPAKAGTRPLALTVRRGASVKTTRDFSISRTEYQSLSRGAPLRLLVAVEGPEGHRAVELVRLTPVTGGEAN